MANKQVQNMFGVTFVENDIIKLFKFVPYLRNAIENDDWRKPWNLDQTFSEPEKQKILIEAKKMKIIRSISFVVTDCRSGKEIISNPESNVITLIGFVSQTLNDFIDKNLRRKLIDIYKLHWQLKNIVIKVNPGPYNFKQIKLKDLSSKASLPAVFSVDINLGYPEIEKNKNVFIAQFVIKTVYIKLKKQEQN
jgi:hypothetical protein